MAKVTEKRAPVGTTPIMVRIIRELPSVPELKRRVAPPKVPTWKVITLKEAAECCKKARQEIRERVPTWFGTLLEAVEQYVQEKPISAGFIGIQVPRFVPIGLRETDAEKLLGFIEWAVAATQTRALNDPVWTEASESVRRCLNDNALGQSNPRRWGLAIGSSRKTSQRSGAGRYFRVGGRAGGLQSVVPREIPTEGPSTPGESD